MLKDAPGVKTGALLRTNKFRKLLRNSSAPRALIPPIRRLECAGGQRDQSKFTKSVCRLLSFIASY